MAAKPIKELLRSLREERGWSREKLSHLAYAIDESGTSLALITSIENGTRRASARTMLALAEALEIEPTEFAEYRLALARHQLDEQLVGLDDALTTLDRSKLEPIDVPADEIRRASHTGRREASQQAARTVGRTRGRKKK